MTDLSSQRNPDWTWDEEILAFEVYLHHGPLGDESAVVVELSERLRALPIHPLTSRTPTFRNPNGVARKLADIHTHKPGYTGRPTSGSRLDEEIWDVYSKEPEQLRATAEAIIEGAETFSTPEDDEVDIEAVHREGRITYRMHRRRERDPRLRERKIAQLRRIAPDLACEACGSELRKVYGEPGDAVFECHHLVPLHISGETVTTLDDVALLCPTCHRVDLLRGQALKT